MGLRLHFGSCASESGPSDGVKYGTQGLQGPGQAILAVRTAGQVCIPVPRCFGGRSSTVIHFSRNRGYDGSFNPVHCNRGAGLFCRNNAPDILV